MVNDKFIAPLSKAVYNNCALHYAHSLTHSHTNLPHREQWEVGCLAKRTKIGSKDAVRDICICLWKWVLVKLNVMPQVPSANLWGIIWGDPHFKMNEFVRPSCPIMMEYSTMLFQRDIHDIRTFIIALGAILIPGVNRAVQNSMVLYSIVIGWNGRTN